MESERSTLAPIVHIGARAATAEPAPSAARAPGAARPPTYRRGIGTVAQSSPTAPGRYRLLAPRKLRSRKPTARHDPIQVSIGGRT